MGVFALVSIDVKQDEGTYMGICAPVVVAVVYFVELASLAVAPHMTVELVNWSTGQARRVRIAYSGGCTSFMRATVILHFNHTEECSPAGLLHAVFTEAA